MVYLYEIADPRYKAVTGSLGYISLGAGVVLGILVVAAIISAIPECEWSCTEQLRLLQQRQHQQHAIMRRTAC
jgi:hypothetical protein